jgi:hypothetical protein
MSEPNLKAVDEINAQRDREERLHRAMDAHLAQREAAAAVSTSLAEAQEAPVKTRQALVESIGDMILTMALLLGDREGDQFMQEMVASDSCYAASRHIKWTEDKLRSQATYILRLCGAHRGGDVDDDKIVRATQFQEQLQGSLDRWDILLEAAKNAYETIAEKVWMPNAPGQPFEVKADTDAKRAALRAAQGWLPHNNQKPHTTRPDQRLPNDRRHYSGRVDPRKDRHPAFDDEIPF